jgi:RNA recognition motif-containing protein
MRNEGEPSRSLWVGNVSPEASEHELQDIFQQFGPVDAVKVLHSHPIALDPTFVFNA